MKALIQLAKSDELCYYRPKHKVDVFCIKADLTSTLVLILKMFEREARGLGCLFNFYNMF